MLGWLWLTAWAVRAGALVIGLERARPAWVLWAGVSAATDTVMIAVNGTDLYQPWWITEQALNIAFLAVLAHSVSRPPSWLTAVAGTASALLCALLWVRHPRYSAAEPVIQIAGAALIAMGLATASVAVMDRDRRDHILTAYLLLSGVIKIAAPDYMTATGVGCAVSLLEIAAFGAWAAVFLGKKHRSTAGSRRFWPS
jgi:hypothetical protein